MKLAAWLESTKTPDAAFAERIGVSRQALWRYKTGERIPRRPILAKIAAATDNNVRADDFFEVAA